MFICAMSEVERVKVEGQVDVFQTIKGMRIQRPHMVETAVSVHWGECVPEHNMCTYYVHINVYIHNVMTVQKYICYIRVNTVEPLNKGYFGDDIISADLFFVERFHSLGVQNSM